MRLSAIWLKPIPTELDDQQALLHAADWITVGTRLNLTTRVRSILTRDGVSLLIERLLISVVVSSARREAAEDDS